jgi:ribosomal protein S18 acetylase RimI-like enzyme
LPERELPETEVPEFIELRIAEDGDAAFLFQLYCDIRHAEVSGWGWPAAQREAFLRMQFEAQRRSYAAAYPGATDEIVCLGGLPVGRRLVSAIPDGMRLVDIGLLSEYRNRGIGTRLIRQFLESCDVSCEAGPRIASLQVLRGNPAGNLYRRLGFRETGSDGMYIQMQRLPKGVSA